MPARRTSPAPPIPSALTDEEWRDFLFIRTNPRGHHFERWRHIHGCARFFNAVRETVSDRFLTTYKAGEPRPDIASLTGGDANDQPPPPGPRPRRPRQAGPLHLRRQGLPGPRRRHARLGAARQRRPPDGPLVQVPPPARRRLRRLRRAERADGHPPRPRPLRAEHPRHDPGAARRPEAESQNRWPSLGFDVGAVNDRLGSLFSAGFYYKTFMWPRPSGTGSTSRSSAAPPASASRADRARRRPLRQPLRPCDVLVVGAGPAGLAAALAAGRSGATVMLVDETAEPGGSLLSEPAVVIDGKPAWDWLAADPRRARPRCRTSR